MTSPTDDLAQMSDLELTKRCAEAMGYRHDEDGGYSRLQQGAGMDDPAWFEFIYDPLHDDAQAMALVKKFDIVIEREGSHRETWGITLFQPRDHGKQRPVLVVRNSPDLNRAIVECVAKLKAAND